MRAAFLLLSFAVVGSCLTRGNSRATFGSQLARRAPTRARAASHLSDSRDVLPEAGDLDDYLARLWGSSEEELDDDAQRHHSIFERDAPVGSAEEEEKQEFALMYKLRKELGDADFKAIFGTRSVTGPPSFDGGVFGR